MRYLASEHKTVQYIRFNAFKLYNVIRMLHIRIEQEIKVGREKEEVAHGAMEFRWRALGR